MDKSADSSRTFFQEKRNLYAGDKSLWQRFEQEVKAQVHVKLGREGISYLCTDHPAEPRFPGEFILPPEYIPVKVPMHYENVEEIEEIDAITGLATLRQVTDKDRTRINIKRKAAIAINDKIDKFETLCMGILTVRVSEQIIRVFNSFEGNPIKCWQYLKSNFGPASMGFDDVSSMFYKLHAMQQKTDTRLSQHMVDVEYAIQYCKLSK
jgi:hypothetical protein